VIIPLANPKRRQARRCGNRRVRPYPVKGQWHGASRKQSFARAGWKRLSAQAGHLGEAAFLESRHHGGTMLSCQFD